MKKLKSLIQNLIKANQRLKEAVKAKPTRMNKDATIQRFEFTFELAWKTIQAYVEDQGFSCKSPKSCLREGARLEVIENPMDWFDYLNARNLIIHTYNEKQADKVYRQARKFSKEINELLTKIKS